MENFFKSRLIAKYKNFRFNALIFLLPLLLLNFLAFRALQREDSSRLLTAINSLLRNETMIANPYQLSKSVSDIETLGLVDCVVLREGGANGFVFYDTSSKPDCYINSWIADIRTIETSVTSINGHTFFLKIQRSIDNAKALFEVLSYLAIVLIYFQVNLKINRNAKLNEVRLQAVELEKKMMLDHAHQIRHDVASPLTAINTIVRLIPDINPELKSVLILASERMQMLFNDLAVSIQNKGTSEPNEVKLVSEIDVVPTLKIILSEKKATWPNNVEFKFEDRTNGKALVKAEEKQFAIVISNILNNALEACESIEQPMISIQTEIINAYLKIGIIDNGSGISAENLQRIGTQGVTFGKEKHATSGSGLGLYSAIQTLKNWGGELKIASIPNTGTTVTLFLKVVS